MGGQQCCGTDTVVPSLRPMVTLLGKPTFCLLCPWSLRASESIEDTKTRGRQRLSVCALTLRWQAESVPWHMLALFL